MTDFQPAPVLLLGATSATGTRLISGLLDAGAVLIAVTRKAPDFSRPNLTWLQQDPEHEYVRVQAQVVISADAEALPAAARQARAMPSLRRMIALSSSSVIFKQRSTDPDERRAAQRLGRAEQELKTLAEKRGFDLTLLRPTLVYGGDGTSALSAIRKWLERRNWAPIAGRGLRQPVHADDLADLIRILVARHQPGCETFDLGGGETLPYPEFVRRVGASAGVNPTLLRIPARVITPLLRLAHRLGRFQSITPAMVARQRMDLVVDDTKARAQLGWNPRPFRP
ncbi:MAG: hypothetical protein WD397_02825 [Wenzhouxiangellaceae bacterium]